MLDATTLRFAAVGVASTLIVLALKLGNVAANALGYAVGIIVSFFLNKHWTCSHAGRLIPAFGRFLGVIAVAYAANLGTVLVAVEGLGWNHYVAQALGVIPYTIVGYLGSRLVAFRGPGDVAILQGMMAGTW